MRSLSRESGLWQAWNTVLFVPNLRVTLDYSTVVFTVMTAMSGLFVASVSTFTVIAVLTKKVKGVMDQLSRRQMLINVLTGAASCGVSVGYLKQTLGISLSNEMDPIIKPRLEQVAIGDLQIYPDRHPDLVNVNHLKGQICKDGVLVPLLVTHDYTIIDGLARYHACYLLNLVTVPCNVLPVFTTAMANRMLDIMFPGDRQ